MIPRRYAISSALAALGLAAINNTRPSRQTPVIEELHVMVSSRYRRISD